MNCSADGPQPPAAAAAPVVATILKNDRRSITLIHSSAAQMLDVLRYRRGALWMKTGGVTRGSGLQPCEAYHVDKASVYTTSTLLRLLHRAPTGPGRRGEILVAVGERDEGGLELRGGQEDTALQHRVEVARVAGGVRALGGGVVGDRAVGEEDGEHRPYPVDRHRYPARGGGLRHVPPHPPPHPPQPPLRARPPHPPPPPQPPPH